MGLDTILSARCSHEVVRLPVIIRIQEDCAPEVAAGLDIFHKEINKRKSKRNEKRPLHGDSTRHAEIETALIQALAPLQNTLDFGGLISKTNDYKQTLAHFAVLYGYSNLLKRLVGWNIDLTIADVNGFTALHSAYKKGDRVCVALLVEKGASETVLDALGRAPSHLMPDGFASLKDHDPDMTSDGQPDLEQKLDTSSLFQSTDSKHVVLDSGDEKAKNKVLAPAPVLPPTANSTTIATLTVNVQTPKYKDGTFWYRERIIAQVSLTGAVLTQFDQVVLGPMPPNESQLALWCFAQCGSCISFVTARCNPTSFFLDPLRDPKHNKGFVLNPLRGTLTGDVAFNIPFRPKRPRRQDQWSRCNCESLM